MELLVRSKELYWPFSASLPCTRARCREGFTALHFFFTSLHHNNPGDAAALVSLVHADREVRFRRYTKIEPPLCQWKWTVRELVFDRALITLRPTMSDEARLQLATDLARRVNKGDQNAIAQFGEDKLARVIEHVNRMLELNVALSVREWLNAGDGMGYP